MDQSFAQPPPTKAISYEFVRATIDRGEGRHDVYSYHRRRFGAICLIDCLVERSGGVSITTEGVTRHDNGNLTASYSHQVTSGYRMAIGSGPEGNSELLLLTTDRELARTIHQAAVQKAYLVNGLRTEVINEARQAAQRLGVEAQLIG